MSRLKASKFNVWILFLALSLAPLFGNELNKPNFLILLTDDIG
jgi:hypothetical protein